MSLFERERKVKVKVIQCDRDGCEETVAPEHEPMQGWTAIVAMEAVQRAGFQPRPGDPSVSKYLCPQCSKVAGAVAERLALLIEECAEVQQVAAKALRHGFDSPHPDSRVTNRTLLEQEVGDLVASIHLLTWNGDIDSLEVKGAECSKYVRLKKWLHHNKSCIPNQTMVKR